MNVADYIADSDNRHLDGSILCFTDETMNPSYSFAKINDHGIVEEVREKQPISTHATVGIYYYAKGSSFVNGAVDMVVHNDRVNNEFYVAPVYNYAIAQGEKFGIYDIEFSQMHGTGTPADLDKYIAFKTLE